MIRVLSDITNLPSQLQGDFSDSIVFQCPKFQYPNGFPPQASAMNEDFFACWNKNPEFAPMPLQDLWNFTQSDLPNPQASWNEPFNSHKDQETNDFYKEPSPFVSNETEPYQPKSQRKHSANQNANQQNPPIKEEEVKFKTELCKNWMERGQCNYGSKCRFAHGREELVVKPISNSKYKSKPCLSFHKYNYCPYGHRCLFKHDERTFNDLERSYYSNLLKIPYLRSLARKECRRLPIFEQLSDKSEYELNRIYVQQSKTIKHILLQDDSYYEDGKIKFKFELPDSVPTKQTSGGRSYPSSLTKKSSTGRRTGGVKENNRSNNHQPLTASYKKSFVPNGHKQSKNKFVVSRYNILKN